MGGGDMVGKIAGQVGNIIFRPARENLELPQLIAVGVGAFLVGGFGAVACGYIDDENEEPRHFLSFIHPAEIFFSSIDFVTSKLMGFTFKPLIRFVGGGCIYFALDFVIIQVTKRRVPFLVGGVTSIFFADESNHIKIASVVGMALFAQAADMLFDIIIYAGR